MAAAAKSGFLGELRKNRSLFVLLSPTLLFFLVFSYLPMSGLYFAFTRFNFRAGLWKSPFVGLDNFDFLFKSNILFTITKNTILFNIAFIIFGNLTAILAAIFLNEVGRKRFRKITQSVMFLPYFVSFVLMAAFVYNIFNFEYGTFNSIRRSLGLESVSVYSQPGAWKYILVSFHVWKQLGYCSVIYLAAILGIDSEIYEAAEIDGAHVFQKVWYIVLPQLFKTFLVILMFNIGSILRGQFELFWNVVGNNPLLFDATDIIDTYVYRSLTTTFDMGMTTAAGLYQSVFGLVLVVAVNWLLRRKSPENAFF
jgi:putative aldouronate transport system permease protein